MAHAKSLRHTHRLKLSIRMAAGSHAWNCGIDIARGEAIAFLDGDDIWPPYSLAVRVQRLLKYPDLDCIIGRVKFFLQEGHPIPRGFRPELLEGSRVAYMPGTAMIRRSVFDALGKFDENWRIVNDLAWFAKLRNSEARIDFVDDVLLRKRIHSSNLSNVAAAMPMYREELLSFAKESVMSRRALRE